MSKKIVLLHITLELNWWISFDIISHKCNPSNYIS